MYLGVIGSGLAQSDRIVELVLQDAAQDFENDMLVFARDTESHSLGVACEWAQARGFYTSCSSMEAVLKHVIEKKGQLYVLWNPDDMELHRIVEEALANDVVVRDICDGGTQLAKIQSNKGQSMPKRSEPQIYTREFLESLLLGAATDPNDDPDPQLDAIAKTYKIDPETIETWPGVVDAILEAQGGPAEPAAAEPAAGDDEGKFVPWTQDELQALCLGDGTAAGKAAGLAAMKQLVLDWNLELPGPRPRGDALIGLILDAQDAYLSTATVNGHVVSSEGPDLDEPGTVHPIRPDVEQGVIDIDVWVEAARPMVEEVVANALDALGTKMADDAKVTDEAIGGISDVLSKLVALVQAMVKPATSASPPVAASRAPSAPASAPPVVARRPPPRR